MNNAFTPAQIHAYKIVSYLYSIPLSHLRERPDLLRSTTCLIHSGSPYYTSLFVSMG